ncbi:diketogulonate reductase-like aldo/keto reductase [Natronospira proteinivora]|uniref:Diketogulonate reductase-like aldo/keto reductase n=1 Tax=Natronospira proteinivora TaxID=1807133 RepID=A0ABT1GBB4_9GAMM|nr:aldo/keto reductase [Natronospira proteinivora]MCP1728215.1 diketogulonate reductase-like aldo/keto reductase [Natronospira proteinivora]
MWNVKCQGASIPALGFGTFELAVEDAARMVEHALQAGYRHIDTAQIYGNEQGVGEALAHAPFRREEIFLTTKVWIDAMRSGKLEASVEASLEKLQTDYVDLLLLHWPNPKVDFQAMFDALNTVKEQGLARHIGVSNYPSDWLARAQEASRAPLVTNQIEYHPFLAQNTLFPALREADMVLTAYCPLAQGRVFENDTLKAIGEKHGKNPGQIALRWLIQQDGVVAIPRSSREANASANIEIFDFELSEGEMKQITALADPNGRVINPEGLAPEWD